jgi:N-methylhydantoinase A
MARALRVVSVERGVDPRDYALVAFGGAGPMHATAVADELSMDRILCPPTSGVLAALGLVVSERRRDAQRSVLLSGRDLDAGAVASAFAELADRARAALAEPGAGLRAVYELRYRGQAFELPVEVEGEAPAEPEALRQAFAGAHDERYGYADDEAGVEVVTVRATATTPGPDVTLAGDEGAPEAIAGPAVVPLPEATVLVPAGWSGRHDATGTLVLERVG